MSDVTILATATGSGSSGLFLYVILGALVLMMFFGSRRTRKAQREAAEFRNNLEPGTEVMTGSGFFGTIAAVDGDRVTLMSVDGARSTWIRAAISKVVEPEIGDDELVVPDDAETILGTDEDIAQVTTDSASEAASDANVDTDLDPKDGRSASE